MAGVGCREGGGWAGWRLWALGDWSLAGVRNRTVQNRHVTKVNRAKPEDPSKPRNATNIYSKNMGMFISVVIIVHAAAAAAAG